MRSGYASCSLYSVLRIPVDSISVTPTANPSGFSHALRSPASGSGGLASGVRSNGFATSNREKPMIDSPNGIICRLALITPTIIIAVTSPHTPPPMRPTHAGSRHSRLITRSRTSRRIKSGSPNSAASAIGCA